MIHAILLAAVLAAPPAPEPTPAPASPLSERITLDLQKASLVDTLEKLAFLMDATPIIDPGVESETLTVKVFDMPIAKVISMIEAAAKVQIRFETITTRPPLVPAEKVERRLLVSRAAPGIPRPAPATAAKETEPPARAFEFRTARGAATRWTASESVTTVELPDCRAPVRVGLLRADDGGRVVVLDGSGNARIVRPTRPEAPAPTFTLFGCREPFVLRRSDERGDAEPGRRAVEIPLVLVRMRLVEVARESERVITEPKVMVPVGESFQVRSGGEAQEIQVHGLLLECTDADALLALSITVDRETDPGKGMTRVAQSDQTLRVAFEKSERVTISSTYGQGRSALVADLMLSRPVKKP